MARPPGSKQNSSGPPGNRGEEAASQLVHRCALPAPHSTAIAVRSDPLPFIVRLETQSDCRLGDIPGSSLPEAMLVPS